MRLLEWRELGKYFEKLTPYFLDLLGGRRADTRSCLPAACRG
jgi:hypothetical protein